MRLVQLLDAQDQKRVQLRRCQRQELRTHIDHLGGADGSDIFLSSQKAMKRTFMRRPI